MTEKSFGTLPIGKLFFKCALPSMVSMLFSSLFIMADGVFVGQFIGNTALAAVNAAWPFLTIIFAVADMIALGSSVRISLALGENNQRLANKIFSASLILVFIMSALFSIAGIIVAENIHSFIKEQELATYIKEYFQTFGFFGVGFIPLFAVDNYLRICGKQKLSMMINVSTSILNIILDWLFIVVLDMGIGAAAMASGIGGAIGENRV